MLRTLICPLGIALLLTTPAAALAQGETTERATGDLRYTLSAGDELDYTYSWHLEQTGEVKGMPTPPQTRTYEIAYDLDQEVTSVEEGVATIDAEIAAIRMTINLGVMGDLSYDSDADEESNPLRSVRHAAGKSFSYTMTGRGEVTSVSGGDALREEIMAAAQEEMKDQPGGGMGGGGMGGGGMGGMGGMDPSAMAGQLMGQLSVIFSDDMIQTSLTVVSDVLPEDGVASEGDSWTRPVEEDVPQLGKLSYTASLTHQGSAKGNVRITSRPEGEIELEPGSADAGGEEGGNPMQDMARKMQEDMLENMEVTKSSARGTSTFATGPGRLLDSEIVQQIDMEGPLPEMFKAMLGKKAADMTMSQSVELTMRYAEREGDGTTGGGAGSEGDESEGDGAHF